MFVILASISDNSYSINSIYLGGFNDFFWLLILMFAGILFLGMFVTFGFSVAQGMNDLKQEFIDKQIELNNELESKVN
ncbi:MAG: hypothetical protein CL913_09830, partial [Deltaproteobacteria bacterium]|nr:hypothetical protein [Deltaproteobacteria bacterium]